MMDNDIADLPIAEVLPDIKATLASANEAVLQAPPGAGKTTVVPLALLRESWLTGRKIYLLEPRRLAARAAAARMASMLGEAVGETVGYRIRLDSKVGPKTRIEVITEGVLTRLMQADPSLEDVGLLIFDEFHERNLDSDLCLALSLQGRKMFRETAALKLLVMSATLDAEPVARLMGNASVITCEGRQFAVATYYGAPYRLRDSIVSPVVTAIARALVEHRGGILVFLPGQREIRRVTRELEALGVIGEGVELAPLFGSLSLEEQQVATRSTGGAVRKIVLATNIAESSLTVADVEVVIDSGLARASIFSPTTGTTRLATRRISKASAEQRRGRAGREGPGVCYRLWSEEQQRRLVDQSIPEILQADLAPMALQLLSWGVDETDELAWLDQPPAAHYAQAIDILTQCGAAFSKKPGSLQLTPHGVRLAQLPLHPRLAHMLLVGCDIHARESACLLAAILGERNPLAEKGADISHTVDVLLGKRACPPHCEAWFKRVWREAGRFARLAGDVHKPRKFAIGVDQADVLGILLASAYPDRIARRRTGGERNQYLLSSGRGAQLPDGDVLAGTEWLAVAEVGGATDRAVDRIYSATALNPGAFREMLSGLVRQQDHVEWDEPRERFLAERRHMVGNILLSVEPLTDIPPQSRIATLLDVLREKGIDVLPWSKNLQQWRARVTLLHKIHNKQADNPWPDLSDQALLDSMEDWLLPHLGEVAALTDLKRLDLKAILRGQLNWPLPLELERLAPECWMAPSGSRVAIDYTRQPPVLAVKLQEMFGAVETPVIAQGKVQLQVHLLSPAGRPLQITQDLAAFWDGAYREIQREMKGRYPKHPWPDDPLAAKPTRHTKAYAQQR